MDLFVAYTPQQDAEPGGMGDVSPIFSNSRIYIAYKARIPICLKVII